LQYSLYFEHVQLTTTLGRLKYATNRGQDLRQYYKLPLNYTHNTVHSFLLSTDFSMEK